MPSITSNLPRALETRARDIVKALGGHWSGRQGMCHCPAHDDRTPSLSIGVAKSAILFHCFAGCSSAQVLDGLKRHGIRASDLFDGKGATVIPSVAATGPDRNALRLWREAKPIWRTLADHYLLDRLITLRAPDLKFHSRTPLGRRPNAQFLPAMLAAVRMDIGIVAVHRTFLDPQTARKANFFKPKRAIGKLGSGAVRLFPPKDGKLGLAEGTESALSAQMLHDIPCWATLGNERFGIVSVPENVDELHLFIDADASGDLALARALDAYARPGRDIIEHRPKTQGQDWNDALRLLRHSLVAN